MELPRSLAIGFLDKEKDVLVEKVVVLRTTLVGPTVKGVYVGYPDCLLS